MQSFVYDIAFPLGMIIVILGTLTAIVDVFFFVYKCWGYEAATPLWTGTIFILTGVLACCMRGCKESKGAVRTVFAMCIVSAVMAVLLGGHGWVAATQEHTSPSCGHGIDAGCTSMTGRISIDVSMVVLAILVFEIVILTAIVTYFMMEGGPIGPFEKIEGLPIGKGRSRGPGTRSAATVSSNAKRYPEPTSAEEGEAIMMATSSPTNYELGSEPPTMRYIPDPDYSTADDLEDEKQIEKPDSAFVTTTVPPPSQGESTTGEQPAVPVEYAKVNKANARNAALTSAPPPAAVAAMGAAVAKDDREPDSRSELPPLPEPEPEPEPKSIPQKQESTDSDSESEFVAPLLPSNLNESGPHEPLKPRMDIVRQSLILRASSSEETIPSGTTTPTSGSSANSSPKSARSETAPSKKTGSPASQGSGSSNTKSKSSSSSSISAEETSGKQETIV
ncbi:nucleolar and coiled-body phosphoprotein 1-like isoform X2 [Ptychodera flava]|uniref:nucleolar and coiled-body phosphoprotein 1-like isoform X2 n=1 Tax=Ptychodera flava TaxID=63121 RepID=UPI003969CEC8